MHHDYFIDNYRFILYNFLPTDYVAS